MGNRALLIAGVVAMAAGLIGMGFQGTPGPAGGWTMPMGGPGHMSGWWRSDSPTSGTISGAEELVITGTDFALSPPEVRLVKGATINLVFVNDGTVPHDLAIPELGVRVAADPGETAATGFTSTRTGSFDIVCTYPGHASAGMTGVLVITDGE